MNKTELLAAVAGKAGITKAEADRVLAALQSVITEELKNSGRVQITGFGVFESHDRGARTVRNPFTQEIIEIPAARVANFKPSKALKDAVAGK